MNKPIGTVYLVGAGPGDPSLITLRGVDCLAQADVVLYDYLVNPQVLRHAPASAELVCLGRHGQGRIMTQQAVNDRLVADARGGQTVVRLKAGDPAIFARGAEEVQALTDAGIPFEIVPGITAALAAGSYAGIPITHGRLASAVALVTGQQREGKGVDQLDYRSLAQFPGTLVFYMGVTTAPDWCRTLIDGGKSPDTPVAIVRRCSWYDQVTRRGTLADIPELLASDRMRPPVIVIIGPVAELADNLDWVAQRSLFGQQVLVTRPRDQADGLIARLTELGAGVLTQAAIEISDPPDWQSVDAAIKDLSSYDWLVFSSANGVRRFFDRLASLGFDTRQLGGVRLAAIGPATTDALGQYHLNVDVQPEEYRAEALAAALAPGAANQRVLLARASRGREVLAEQLSAAGAQVDQIIVYQSTDVAAADDDIAAALRDGQIDFVTVTSSAIARSLVGLFGDALRKTRLITISPLTSETLAEFGHQAAAEASEYTTDGVVDALLRAAATNE